MTGWIKERATPPTASPPRPPVAGQASTPARRTRHTANQQQNPCRERFRVSGFRAEGFEGKQNRTEHNGTRQTPETGALSRHKKIPELTESAQERERARLNVRVYGRPGEPKTFWCADRSRAAVFREEVATTVFENPADKNLFPAF